MKVLVVTYLPGGIISNTKKLVDHAVDIMIKRRVQLDLLDLTQDVPDLFSPERLAVYYERNYGGKKVSPEKTALMAKMDRMTEQLKNADMLVLAYPMHNFSTPATVKAWFDSVMLKGQTWDFTPTGYTGFLKDRNALVLSTSGGVYEGELSFLEHSASLAKADLGFMGLNAEVVVAAGINKFPDKVPQTIANATNKITEVLNRWIP